MMLCNKKSFYIIFILLLGLFSGVYANWLVMEPTSDNGVKTYTGKYFCDYNIDVKFNYSGIDYSIIDYHVLFSSGDETLRWMAGNDRAYWNEGNGTGYYKKSGDLNAFYGKSVGKDVIHQSTILLKLILNGKNPLKENTVLKFVNNNFQEQSNFTVSTTNGLTVGGYVDGQYINILSQQGGVRGITVPYEACPCILDSNKPQTYVTGDSVRINDGRLTGLNKEVTLLVYDQGGDTTWKYSYSGMKSLSNYKNWGISNMDNQEGVNSGTIVIKIYSGTSASGTPKEILSGSDFVNVEFYTGTKIGNTSYPAKTWDLNDRGYWVTFKNSGFEYKVEQPVTIEIVAYDNALNGDSSVCQRDRTGGSLQTKYTFNRKSDPIINFLTPSGSENVSPSTSFSVELTDPWAGIDTGTFTLEFPTITGENDEIIFTGFTINSGNLMGGTFTRTGGQGNCETGDACGYIFEVKLDSELPANTTITITGYVEDLVGNSQSMPKTFTTMQSCKFFGCGNSTNINYVDDSLGSVNITFTGSIIVLTGLVENNMGVDGESYPRFVTIGADEQTGEGGEEILMCGILSEHPNLTGNINVWSGSEVYTGSYDNNELYITGLNWSYQSGVIIIND